MAIDTTAMPFEQSIPSNQSVKRQIQNVRDGDEAMYAGQTFAFSPGSYFASGYAGELDKAIFGHIHGDAYFPLRQVRGGIEYILTSCDTVGFSLQRIL